MTRRGSLSGTVAFLLFAASLSGCAQNIVLEDQIDGGASSPNDGSSGDGHCSGTLNKVLPFTQESPEVVVALDRSSAMNSPFGTDPSQLASAVNALTAQVVHFGAQPQGNPPLIRFAFIDFPDTADDCNAALGCCSSDVTPTASYTAFDNAATACNACFQSPQRPTANALSKSLTFLNNDFQAGKHYVLLVTDGAPNDCESSGKDPCNAALAQIGNLQNAGVQTTIVDIGNGSPPAGCLLNLASAEGAEGPPFYYTASSPNDLTTMLATITGAMSQDACRLDLSTAPGPPDQLSVLFNGNPLPRDSGHINGWDLNGGGTRVTLYGAACQDLMQFGSASVNIVEGCSGGHFGQGP